jgi:hypothetical protein
VKTIDCTREQDVLDALSSGRWPDCGDDELVQHAASCAICADVIQVAQTLLVERDDQTLEPRIPSSAVMWWRAQMRARHEAAREAERPITVAQIVGIVCAIVGIGALAAMISPRLRAVLVDFSAATSFNSADVQHAVFAYGWLIPVAMLSMLLLLLTPLVVYWATEDEK